MSKTYVRNQKWVFFSEHSVVTRIPSQHAICLFKWDNIDMVDGAKTILDFAAFHVTRPGPMMLDYSCQS